MLIPALTMQAQNVLTPEQQLEKAQKELEEAKKALEAAKAQAEAAKVKAEAEKVKAEAEKTKAEAERLKAEAERMKQEAEKLKKNTENSVPATKLVPATKKENTTETSEGAMGRANHDRGGRREKGGKDCRGRGAQGRSEIPGGSHPAQCRGKSGICSRHPGKRKECRRNLQHRFPIYEQAHQE